MFSSATRFRTLIPALFLIWGLSCSKSTSSGVQRLAVLRFENLSGDDSLDWMGRAAAEVVGARLAAARDIYVIPFPTVYGWNRMLGPRPVSAPGISAERSAAVVAGATRILYGRVSRRGGTLELDAALANTSTQQIERTMTASGPVSRGIIALAAGLVEQMDVPVRPLDTSSDQALREYCAGLEASDQRFAAQAFSRAIAADSNYGAAYVAWAQVAEAQGDKAEAERIVALAASRGTAISELERARIAAVSARLRGDFAGSIAALETVGRLHPADLGLFRQLAQANLNARRYQAAAGNLRKAVSLEPDDPVILNQLGYAEMYAGNLADAQKAIQAYARLRPDDANAFDSLGDVNFSLGQFAEAEKHYLQASVKNANFAAGAALGKAAHARLMTGDVAGASEIFNRYLENRRNAKDSLVEYRRAEWEYRTGHRRQAVDRMETFARAAVSSPSADVASAAYCQLAIWELALGDRSRARNFAMKAASTPRAGGAAAIAAYLTEEPASAAEWSERAGRMFPAPGQQRAKNLTLAYALLLAREFQAAASTLQDVYQHSAPEPSEQVPALLAWALEEAGKWEQAAPLLARNPVPNVGADVFSSLSFPRLLFLRGALAERQNKPDEAARNYRLFLTLSGPHAEIFGQEERARQFLAGSNKP